MKTNNEKSENLKDLFAKFVDSERAEQAVKDIETAEQILQRYPAPEPDKVLVDSIKAEITSSLMHRSGVFRKTFYKTTVAVAAVILIGFVSVKLLIKILPISEPAAHEVRISAAIWDSDDISADDVDLATLTAEIEQIKGELANLQIDESGENGYDRLTELELELIEINGDFWKG